MLAVEECLILSHPPSRVESGVQTSLSLLSSGGNHFKNLESEVTVTESSLNKLVSDILSDKGRPLGPRQNQYPHTKIKKFIKAINYPTHQAPVRKLPAPGKREGTLILPSSHPPAHHSRAPSTPGKLRTGRTSPDCTPRPRWANHVKQI